VGRWRLSSTGAQAFHEREDGLRVEPALGNLVLVERLPCWEAPL
jgi:hypothetical protein